MNSKQNGFTLIEVIIVIIIVGILAVIAGPMLTGSIEDAKGMKATANLRIIGAAARMYYYDTGYANLISFAGLSDINDKYNLTIRDPAGEFAYSGNHTGPSYNFTATRSAGPYSTTTLVVDQNSVISGTWPFPHDY